MFVRYENIRLNQPERICATAKTNKFKSLYSINKDSQNISAIVWQNGTYAMPPKIEQVI